jgi:hypothetical protein
MVKSGARSRFCHDEPSLKTTRKQTCVFAPISSMVFLNLELMILDVARERDGDIDIFRRNFEACVLLPARFC